MPFKAAFYQGAPFAKTKTVFLDRCIEKESRNFLKYKMHKFKPIVSLGMGKYTQRQTLPPPKKFFFSGGFHVFIIL